MREGKMGNSLGGRRTNWICVDLLFFSFFLELRKGRIRMIVEDQRRTEESVDEKRHIILLSL